MTLEERTRLMTDEELEHFVRRGERYSPPVLALALVSAIGAVAVTWRWALGAIVFVLVWGHLSATAGAAWAEQRRRGARS